MPYQQPPPGMTPGQLLIAAGSIYGTRDAGRAWYQYSREEFIRAGFVESRLEKGLYYLPGPDGPEAVMHTHVDDCLAAFKKNSPRVEARPEHAEAEVAAAGEEGEHRLLRPKHPGHSHGDPR